MKKTYEIMNQFDEVREMYPILVQFTYKDGAIGESRVPDMEKAIKFVAKIERMARKFNETITDIVIMRT